MGTALLVDDFLDGSAARFPDKVALVCGDRRLTYAELGAASAVLAGQLQALGVRRGDRVVMQLQNCVEAVVSVFGILKAGGVFVPLNPTTKAEKLGLAERGPAPRRITPADSAAGWNGAASQPRASRGGSPRACSVLVRAWWFRGNG